MAARAPFLVAAITGRVLAASAARRGGRRPVVVLDCFGDRDTRALALACRVVVAQRGLRLDGRALLAAADALAPARRCAGLVYGAGFEGRPALLARLAAGRRLYGNDPAVVSALRDPERFVALLDRLGVDRPDTRRSAPRVPAGWLVKEPGGAGGAQVRRATTRRARAGAYYQRFERGRSLSALFLANRRRACLLGFNEQWTASARPGRPFLYGGAVGGIALPPEVESDVRAKLDALVAATGLVGLNGLDFLLGGRGWLALEVNPRPTATVELYDPDYADGLFEWHLRACDGELPDGAAPARAARSHAVVYAPGAMRAPALLPRWCRDLPPPGACFTAGQPICTVHAAAPDAGRAAALVRRRHAQVHRTLVEDAA